MCTVLTIQMLLDSQVMANGSKKRTCECIYSLLKLRAFYCLEIDSEQSTRLEDMAEQVKRAEQILLRYSASANAKAHYLTNTLHGCVFEIWTDMALRAAQEPRGHIGDDIKNTLSFLHTDPEVKRVIEAHQILQHGHTVFEACLQCATVLKHNCVGGCCSFEIAYLHDFESFYTAMSTRI